MRIFLVTMHVMSALVLIVVVLLQHGKGADIGATFGAGASQTVFGGRGAGSFLGKLTTFFVAIFMITSMSLTWVGAPRGVSKLLDESPASQSAAPGSDIEEVPGGAAAPATQPGPAAAPTSGAIEEVPAKPSAPADAAAPAPASAPTTPEAPKNGGS